MYDARAMMMLGKGSHFKKKPQSSKNNNIYL